MPINANLQISNGFNIWVEKINKLGTDIYTELDNAIANNKRPDVFTGSTETESGTSGLVPAPQSQDMGLCSDGEWKYIDTVQATGVDLNVAPSTSINYYPICNDNDTEVAQDIARISSNLRISKSSEGYINVRRSNLVLYGDVEGTATTVQALKTPIIVDGIKLDSAKFSSINEYIVSTYGKYTGPIQQNIDINIVDFQLVIGAYAHIYIAGDLTNLTSLNLNINNTGYVPVTYCNNANFDFSFMFASEENWFSVTYTGTSYEIVSDGIISYLDLWQYNIIAPNVFHNEADTITYKLCVRSSLCGMEKMKWMIMFNGVNGNGGDNNYVSGNYQTFDTSNRASSSTPDNFPVYFYARVLDKFGNENIFSKTCLISSQALKLPELTSPVDGASPTFFTATTDAFTVYGGTDTHVSTDWKVTSDPFGKIVLAEAFGSSDLTSHDFTLTNTVSEGQKLYVWAQHNGQTLGASGWNVTEFTPSFSRHGEVLYDTNGDPAAVVIGSYASGGTEPWNIRGRRVWLAVACMSKRTDSLAWGGQGTDIPTITNSVLTSNQLNDSNTGSGTGNYVSTYTTESQMDAAFNDIGTSDELTTKIIQYGTQNNIDYPVAEYCDSIVLADGTHMDLPSMDALMRIYQAREMIDEVDPTLASSGESSTDGWWHCPWSSCEGSSNLARGVNWPGLASYYPYKSSSSSNLQAFPVLELLAEDSGGGQ